MSRIIQTLHAAVIWQSAASEFSNSCRCTATANLLEFNTFQDTFFWGGESLFRYKCPPGRRWTWARRTFQGSKSSFEHLSGDETLLNWNVVHVHLITRCCGCLKQEEQLWRPQRMQTAGRQCDDQSFSSSLVSCRSSSCQTFLNRPQTPPRRRRTLTPPCRRLQPTATTLSPNSVNQWPTFFFSFFSALLSVCVLSYFFLSQRHFPTTSWLVFTAGFYFFLKLPTDSVSMRLQEAALLSQSCFKTFLLFKFWPLTLSKEIQNASALGFPGLHGPD